MGFYIKVDDLGLFVGEFLGMGFFTKHIIDGTLDKREEPAKFDSKKQAEEYLKIHGLEKKQVVVWWK